jgi:hypothetical protein
MSIAQIVMVGTLLLMISGRVPLYITAILGSTITALIAGIPLFGTTDIVSITSLINGGLNPVIADMVGVLMFIGVMEHVGYLDVIIRNIIKLGRVMGGGPGVATSGGIAAGVIGMLTGFTQPAIAAVITGPASVRLGVNPSKSAGVHAHAGHLGNFGGFTHPTQVAVVAITGIGFGLINVVGIFVSLCIFGFSLFRLRRDERREKIQLTKEQIKQISAEYESGKLSASVVIAVFPFIVLFGGFILGYPIFIVGVISSLLTILLSRTHTNSGEAAMLNGVSRIATPIVATIGFLFMSSVIKNIGLASLIADIFMPFLKIAPLQSMLLVSAFAGLITQSNSASAAISLPFLQAVLSVGADPFTAACMAAGGGAVMQYFLTGGPIAALATTVPVIPGSELKTANRFQRPAMLFGILILFILSILL